MSLFNAPLSESNVPDLVVDKLPELKRKVNEYIDCANVSEWSHRFNRIFISPANSYNTKYLIKYLTSKLAKPYERSASTQVLPTGSSDSQLLISQTEKRFKTDDAVAVDMILDELTDQEFFRLLQMEPEKRIETLMYQHRAFGKALDDLTFDKLCKLNVDSSLRAEVPYEIHTDQASDDKYVAGNGVALRTAIKSGDVLGLLKTCGIIVLDVSRDIESLTNGKHLFKLLKKEILAAHHRGNNDVDVPTAKNKRLIVVVSTAMTWAAGVGKNLKDIMETIVVWAGLTYGFEQDLLKFAFDSACKNTDTFLIPKSQNHIPVVHVDNLARLIHKTISETPKPKHNYIFAVENPTKTLKHVISALGKTCGVKNPTYVSLDTFVDKHKLTGFHKQIISADTNVRSSVDRLWPNFEWYDGCKSLMAYKMKSLVDTYRTEHNIMNIVKLLVLGPPASGKTKLASRLAKYYNSRHLEPREITQNHINGIRGELIQLRQTNHSTYSIDSSDDPTAKVNGTNPTREKRMLELDGKLEELYSSMDKNDGVLEDIYLIPLLNEQILNLFFLKRGYVLDGYPITREQAQQLFIDTGSLQNVNKFPDLIVCLNQTSQCRLPESLDVDTVEVIPVVTKKQLAFTEIKSSSDFKNVFEPNLSVKAAKSILKKSTNSSDNTKTFTGKPERLIWDQRNYNNLLKMLNSNYVQIMTIDSPYSPMEFDVNKVELPKLDTTFEQLLNTVVQEISWSQNNDLLKNLEKTNLTTRKTDVEKNNDAKQKGDELQIKMTQLEDLENIITNFDHVENLSTEKYLMKYVTPTLSELFNQIAKVKPKNPVEFLAAMALKKNPEGLFDCPGYSKKGEEVQTLLERMFKNTNIDDQETTFDSNPLMTFLTTHGENESVVSQE